MSKKATTKPQFLANTMFDAPPAVELEESQLKPQAKGEAPESTRKLAPGILEELIREKFRQIRMQRPEHGITLWNTRLEDLQITGDVPAGSTLRAQLTVAARGFHGNDMNLVVKTNEPHPQVVATAKVCEGDRTLKFG